MHWLDLDEVILCAETGQFFRLYLTPTGQRKDTPKVVFYVVGAVSNGDGDTSYCGNYDEHSQGFADKEKAIEYFNNLKTFLGAKSL